MFHPGVGALFSLLLKLCGALVLVTAAWWWVRRGYRRTRRLTAEAAAARAALSIALSGGLASDFLSAATKTGKPRGLVWSRVEWSGEPLFARDRQTGTLYALVGASFWFEAVAGGDMEDVAAVGDVRGGTAVFAWREGGWASDGRAVLNLEPAEALVRYSSSLCGV
ncbi:MAG: hypothetical protein ACRCT8_03130 [Lacipirellulaceae bacterium]